MSCVLAITGDSASGKSALAEHLKRLWPNTLVLECDRYHRWERGDPHWQSLTHLAPEANHLDKMQADVASLKEGKSICGSEYDHASGRFTVPKMEHPAETLIVCGLHSFYTESHLYDLKIFMDTDLGLRVQWKIDRDTAKRGYTTEKIREQIECRRQDFETYVLPQRSLADLIINFHPIPNGIGLALFIRRKFNIETILQDLSEKGIVACAYDSVDPDFHILKIENGTYDHIMLVILALREQGNKQ